MAIEILAASLRHGDGEVLGRDRTVSGFKRPPASITPVVLRNLSALPGPQGPLRRWPDKLEASCNFLPVSPVHGDADAHIF